MVACVVSALLSEHLRRDSIYTLKLARRGVDLLGAEPDLLDTIPVREAMLTDVTAVSLQAPVGDMLQMFASSDVTSLPVIDSQGALVGIVSRSDAEEAVLRGQTGSSAVNVMTTNPITCMGDESLTLALQRLTSYDVAALPVIDPEKGNRLVGLLRRRDIIQSFQRTRFNRPELAARVERLREAVGGARVFEAEIGANSVLAGKEVRDLALPSETLLVAIRRGERTLIPHGDSVLMPGDRVVALAER
jgi:CBS domain-containing protein